MSETTTSEKPVISAETIKRILAFRDDRNWKQFHNPKDLAISISLEAAELLEGVSYKLCKRVYMRV